MTTKLATKFGTAYLTNNGYYLIGSRNEGNRNKYLHRMIWEDYYGFPIPKNYEIHHKDGNKENNCIMNLQLIRKTEHASLHKKGQNHGIFGENHPYYGKKRPEHSKKMSSKNNPFYGETHSDESRQKMSEFHKGKILSDEHKQNISKAMSGENNPRWKDYARVLKNNVKSRGRVVYYIMYNGKKIKESSNWSKLIKWFRKEYSDVELHVEIDKTSILEKEVK